MVKRGSAFRDYKNPEMRRALGEVRRKLHRSSSTAVARSRIYGSAAGGGDDDDGLSPLIGASIELFVYNPDDPSNPTDSIGTTSTNNTGYWEYDIADYCWNNDIGSAFQITVKINGDVDRHINSPETFWQKDTADGYLPIMVSGRELIT